MTILRFRRSHTPAHPDSSAHPGPATRGHESGPTRAPANQTKLQANPTPAAPNQAAPVRANPVQTGPIRTKPTQVHHNSPTTKSGRPWYLPGLVPAALVATLGLFSCLGLSSCLGIDAAPYQSKPGYPGSQTSAQFTQAMFKEVNAYRQNEGYKPLEWDPLLAELSAQHAVDMAQRATMDHDGFKERYQNSGYTLCVENVASSSGSALQVLGLWQRSPGHDANLLNADIKRVGVAKSGKFISWMACRP